MQGNVGMSMGNERVRNITKTRNGFTHGIRKGRKLGEKGRRETIIRNERREGGGYVWKSNKKKRKGTLQMQWLSWRSVQKTEMTETGENEIVCSLEACVDVVYTPQPPPNIFFSLALLRHYLHPIWLPSQLCYEYIIRGR